MLDDGRQVYVSPNHPLADGRPIGSIARGDIVDGARVIMAELVPEPFLLIDRLKLPEKLRVVEKCLK